MNSGRALGVLLPALALLMVLAVLFAPRSTPRSAPVIPAAPVGVASPDQTQSEALTRDMGSASPPPTVSPPPSGAPSAKLGDATCDRPCATLPPPGISGQATWWYSFGPGLYAAIRPDLGTKGDTAIVCGGRPFHCLTLPITTTCACLGPGSGRLIDLSRDAFASFADPSVGVVQITVQVVH